MAACPAESTSRGIIVTCSGVSSFSTSSIVIGSTLKSSVAIPKGEVGADIDVVSPSLPGMVS